MAIRRERVVLEIDAEALIKAGRAARVAAKRLSARLAEEEDVD